MNETLSSHEAFCSMMRGKIVFQTVSRLSFNSAAGQHSTAQHGGGLNSTFCLMIDLGYLLLAPHALLCFDRCRRRASERAERTTPRLGTASAAARRRLAPFGHGASNMCLLLTQPHCRCIATLPFKRWLAGGGASVSVHLSPASSRRRAT